MHCTFITLLMQLVATGHQAGSPSCLNQHNVDYDYEHDKSLEEKSQRSISQPPSNPGGCCSLTGTFCMTLRQKGICKVQHKYTMQNDKVTTIHYRLISII